jgi:hypothetical protein
VRDQRATEIDLALDLDSGRLERLRIELREDELLGEILGADLQRLRRSGTAERDHRERHGGDAFA